MEKQIMEGTVGEIRMFAGKKPPKNWAFCHGQLIDLNEHEELEAIIGTTYGGDGFDTIALPDLRGRVPIGSNIDEGYYKDLPIDPEAYYRLDEISEYLLPGDMGGENKIQMHLMNLPNHSYSHKVNIRASTKEATISNPNSGLAFAKSKTNKYTPDYNAQDVRDNDSLRGVKCEIVGESAPFENTAPSLGINYIIAIKGEMPETNQL